MAAVNKVILIGNLTRDPELKYTPKGTAVAELGLAVNRKYRVENDLREETTFVDITFWGAQAETVSKWVKKGSPLYVEGRLQFDTWDDKSTGQKRSKLRVVGEGFQFLGGGNRDQESSGPMESSSYGDGGSSSAAPQASSASAGPPPSTTASGPMAAEEEDDDIPF